MGLARTAGPADGSYDDEGVLMPTLLAVAVAGAVGALARYGVDGWVAQRAPGAFPWGTFVINVTGSLLLGLLFTLFSERVSVDPWVRTGLMVGLLGAYTTFSTFSLETYRLIESGAIGLACANAVGSLAAGLGAVYIGAVIGRAL
jgi:fluoride exporter